MKHNIYLGYTRSRFLWTRFLWTFAFYELFFNALWVFIYVNYVGFYELRVLWTFFAGPLRGVYQGLVVSLIDKTLALKVYLKFESLRQHSIIMRLG